MEIRHLRYFLAVAELRNFTRAAEASFVAQSALSQQIGRLEHELGTPLFVRGKRGADLTPAGEPSSPGRASCCCRTPAGWSPTRPGRGPRCGPTSAWRRAG
jgi:hypothetical protein